MMVVEGPGSENVTESVCVYNVVSWAKKMKFKKNRNKKGLTGYISVTPSNRKRLDSDVEPLR